jgi:hypothetical protein
MYWYIVVQCVCSKQKEMLQIILMLEPGIERGWIRVFSYGGAVVRAVGS